jgi:uncharacterized protein YbjQ (UPF0145 family)
MDPMQVSFNAELEDARAYYAIGRVRAFGRWRAANAPGLEADQRAALRALMREAAEYGADALTNVSFEFDDVVRADFDGVPLRRVIAIGFSVRFALAA